MGKLGVKTVVSVEGEPLNNDTITSILSFIIEKFLKKEVKGVMIDKGNIVIQLKD